MMVSHDPLQFKMILTSELFIVRAEGVMLLDCQNRAGQLQIAEPGLEFVDAQFSETVFGGHELRDLRFVVDTVRKKYLRGYSMNLVKKILYCHKLRGRFVFARNGRPEMDSQRLTITWI